MSLETWSTIASVGTFVVISATAIAAIVQLRHMQAANRMATTYQFFHEYEGPMREAFGFVRSELESKLLDPAFRRELRRGQLDRKKHPELIVCNFFDQWGLNYRDGAIDRNSFMRINAYLIRDYWERLAPVIALMSVETGNTAFQQFEYLAVKAQQWIATHPKGDYPKNEPRKVLVDPWAQVDCVSATLAQDQANGEARANSTIESGRE